MTAQLQEAKIKALYALADTVIEAVKLAGDAGIPAGHLYAHLMGILPLSDFERFIGILVAAGRIMRRGDLILPVQS